MQKNSFLALASYAILHEEPQNKAGKMGKLAIGLGFRV